MEQTSTFQDFLTITGRTIAMVVAIITWYIISRPDPFKKKGIVEKTPICQKRKCQKSSGSAIRKTIPALLLTQTQALTGQEEPKDNTEIELLARALIMIPIIAIIIEMISQNSREQRVKCIQKIILGCMILGVEEKGLSLRTKSILAIIILLTFTIFMEKTGN